MFTNSSGPDASLARSLPPSNQKHWTSEFEDGKFVTRIYDEICDEKL